MFFSQSKDAQHRSSISKVARFGIPSVIPSRAPAWNWRELLVSHVTKPESLAKGIPSGPGMAAGLAATRRARRVGNVVRHLDWIRFASLSRSRPT
jgi:hypothetical protein